jgi:hypothetical protein
MLTFTWLEYEDVLTFVKPYVEFGPPLSAAGPVHAASGGVS